MVTVAQLKQKLGYSKTQWDYLTKLVRTLLEEIFDHPPHLTSMSNDHPYRIRCRDLAKSINRERSSPILRWADLEPLQIEEMLKCINEEVENQKMTCLTDDDLKDKVNQQLSYRRRKGTTLPSIEDMLEMQEEAGSKSRDADALP